LPFSLVAKWALSGITEFTLIGLIAGSIVKDKTYNRSFEYFAELVAKKQI